MGAGADHCSALSHLPPSPCLQYFYTRGAIFYCSAQFSSPPHKMKLLLLAMLTAYAVSVPDPGEVTIHYTCDCEYFSGGCKITSPTNQPNTACRCTYQGFWTCVGSPHRCFEPSSPFCGNGVTYEHCLQGQGDCGGYL